MVKVVGNVQSRVTVAVQFEVDEEEARALDALAGYGDDAAIEAFYKNCGKHYLQPYEAGLRRFLSEIRKVVSPALNEADRNRAILLNAKNNSAPPIDTDTDD